MPVTNTAQKPAIARRLAAIAAIALLTVAWSSSP